MSHVEKNIRGKDGITRTIQTVQPTARTRQLLVQWMGNGPEGQQARMSVADKVKALLTGTKQDVEKESEQGDIADFDKFYDSLVAPKTPAPQAVPSQ
jgi:hypothetical protein